MATPTPKLRRTRFVCISDTHNSTVKLPKGDVLIHAGDVTNQGSYSELSKAVKWLESADFEAKIVIAGNHDITLHQDFYDEHGRYFHNQHPQSPAECLALLEKSPSITYLCHESAKIRLRSPNGPHTHFTVFGSPYSPRHGRWAFYYDAPQQYSNYAELTSLWELMPLEADVVVTHTPSRTHGDETQERRATGCEALRQALWRVRPRLAVCGHIHDGRGSERVVWDLSCRNVSYAEKTTSRWEDPGEGNNKISLVDLTGKKGRPLDNDGSHPADGARATQLPTYHDGADPPRNRMNESATATAAAAAAATGDADVVDAQRRRRTSTAGLGGDPQSPRSDGEALLGRTGRRETCIVNAAITKSRHPHIGGKMFNKPIVVDVDLPVWGEDAAAGG